MKINNNFIHQYQKHNKYYQHCLDSNNPSKIIRTRLKKELNKELKKYNI